MVCLRACCKCVLVVVVVVVVVVVPKSAMGPSVQLHLVVACVCVCVDLCCQEVMSVAVLQGAEGPSLGTSANEDCQ